MASSPALRAELVEPAPGILLGLAALVQHISLTPHFSGLPSAYLWYLLFL
jgi:hypothetical protein